MSKTITILDSEYLHWVKDLCQRYRNLQIKAAVKVNQCMLQYYWDLGRDIANKQIENKYGTAFYATLSRDLKHEMPGVEGLSETSMRYAKRFYMLYSQLFENLPQLVEGSNAISRQLVDGSSANSPQLVEDFKMRLFSVPWGHHRYIIDKFEKNPNAAWFYVNKTIENGWSRAMLLNFISTDLYARDGKALTNFSPLTNWQSFTLKM